MKIVITIFVFVLLSLQFIHSQNHENWIYPNKGQWEKMIAYKMPIQSGEMYLEKNGFSYNIHTNPAHIHNETHKRKTNTTVQHSDILKGQFIKSQFIGAKTRGFSNSDSSKHYHNYLLGNDSKKWKSNIYGYKKVTYNELYSGIDLFFETSENKVKYAFKVEPNVDVSKIRNSITGHNKAFIDSEGNLHITHRLGEIIEKKPIAWTINKHGSKTFVDIQYKLTFDTLTYIFPSGYNKNETLIIDPELIFSTFTGSLSDNWGFTATPDESQNLFAGGIIFGVGYPTTPGAYDIVYHDGDVRGSLPGYDISISKFNKTGTSLIYSTYIGGSGNETPNSIIANKKGELFILGTSSSPDFPVSFNAYDKTYAGGPDYDDGMEFLFKGSDIVVTKLSEDGSKIVGSTYVGGSGIDGLSSGDLLYNYGDMFRGEIILTPTEEVMITSSTQSADFPTKNAFQQQLNGVQDAIICKFNQDLSNLIWSSYYGGSGFETGNSVQLSSTGEIYMVGGTTSNNLLNINGLTKTYQGGESDGYIVHLTSNQPVLLNSSYIGTTEYDQNYFVQLDDHDDVYILGQSNGEIAITPGKYGNPNSGLVISKMDKNLSSQSWITTIGGQTGEIEVSPTAFMVSHCADIYFAAWGGVVNMQNSRAIFSTTNNFPITNDAIQSVTQGDNFYIGVLNKDAQSLKYGTFMGGVEVNGYHVDGGTSRFDKNGGIYHAVCGACGGNPNGFITTPGVWSETNKSPNCNLAAFKFELNKTDSKAIASDTIVCLGEEILFTNNSLNADEYEWDLGDGTVIADINPKHTYLTPGKFNVRLIAKDSKNCITADTAFLEIEIISTNQNITEPTIFTCKDSLFTFNFTNEPDVSYEWFPKNIFQDNTIANPSFQVKSDMTITLNKKGNCGTNTYTYPFKLFQDNYQLSEDIDICEGDIVNLEIINASFINWSPSTYLNDPTSATPTSQPLETIKYYVKFRSLNNCKITDSVYIHLNKKDDVYFKDPTIHLCLGLDTTLSMQYLTNIAWTPNQFIKQQGTRVTISATQDMQYSVFYRNKCGDKIETVAVKVHPHSIIFEKDTSICEGDTISLKASGGETYIWLDRNNLQLLNTPGEVFVKPNKTTKYTVISKDINQCKDTASVTINVFKKPEIELNTQHLTTWEFPAKLVVSTTEKGKFVWSPTTDLSCPSCAITTCYTKENREYTVVFTDVNGCIDSARTIVIPETDIYIPNTFTPNNKGLNNYFKAEGYNIRDFKLDIYNRWGEKITTLISIDEKWDGTYNNLECPDGVYTWKATYVNTYGREKELRGHVNILR
jgi:gliding motility-associated-like protein